MKTKIKVKSIVNDLDTCIFTLYHLYNLPYTSSSLCLSCNLSSSLRSLHVVTLIILRFSWSLKHHLYTSALSYPNCYKLKILEWVQNKNLILGSTQENSIENSVQDFLSYIPITHGLCSTAVAYPKRPCVSLKANMH